MYALVCFLMPHSSHLCVVILTFAFWSLVVCVQDLKIVIFWLSLIFKFFHLPSLIFIFILTTSYWRFKKTILKTTTTISWETDRFLLEHKVFTKDPRFLNMTPSLSLETPIFILDTQDIHWNRLDIYQKFL